MEETIKVFISYSWDNDKHKDWVLNLANKLSDNGVYVILDRYDLKAGKTMTQFMENAINNSDKVLMIMTPNYKYKADNRKDGVGYEYSMVTQELYRKQDNNKFIPILKENTYNESAPIFIGTYIYHDMTKEITFDKDFNELLRIIYDEPEIIRPPLGKKPTFNSSPKSNSETAMIDDTLNLSNSKMKTFAKWSIMIELESLQDQSKANIFNLLSSNAPVERENKYILPQILSAKNKISHHPDIIYELPLQRYIVYNHLVHEKLKIEKGLLFYEFSEYSDHDFWLLQLNIPFSTLFYLLVAIKNIHTQLNKEINLTAHIKFESDRDGVLYPDHSPFSVGFLFEKYKIPDNKANDTLKLMQISKDSLYEMFGRIYSLFVSENKKSKKPYPTIDRKHFDMVTDNFLK